MSTDWDVHCKTCDEPLGLEDMNHQSELMGKLIEMAPALAALADSFYGTDLQVERFGTRIDVWWFKKHGGHELVAMNEYGRESDQCYGDFICPACGHKHKCQLKDKHEGEHSREGAA